MTYSKHTLSVEVYDTCTSFDFLPFYETTYDVLDFINNNESNMINKLNSIVFYDSIESDYYQAKLEFCKFAYFSKEHDPEMCPALHFYLNEIFFCAIRGNYSKHLFGKLKMLSDVIYFYLYGKHYLVANIISGTIVHNAEQYSITLTKEEIIDRSNQLYDKYLKNRKEKPSNIIYKILYAWRIFKSKRAMKKWEKYLMEKNKTRARDIEVKKEEYERLKQNNIEDRGAAT